MFLSYYQPSLEAALHYTFNDKSLITQAFSFAGERNNGRLELLGDILLEASLAELILAKCLSNDSLHFPTEIQRLKSNQFLIEIGQSKLGIADHMRPTYWPRLKDYKWVANIVESLLGAIWVDSRQLSQVGKTVRHLYEERFDLSEKSIFPLEPAQAEIFLKNEGNRVLIKWLGKIFSAQATGIFFFQQHPDVESSRLAGLAEKCRPSDSLLKQATQLFVTEGGDSMNRKLQEQLRKQEGWRTA